MGRNRVRYSRNCSVEINLASRGWGFRVQRVCDLLGDMGVLQTATTN